MPDLITTPELANRLARAIASDICLYNEDKIVRGIQQDTLFDEIAGEIQEGQDLYVTRVSRELVEGANFYERALVDLIFKAKGEQTPSQIW
jgi:hypothetical protein